MNMPTGFRIPDSITGRGKLSICMIVKNEEKNIIDCIRSFQDCADEFCIVDTGSEDTTLEKIRGLRMAAPNILIEEHPWENDFAKARNISLGMAKKSWVLWVDADDRLDPQCIDVLKQMKQTDVSEKIAYMIPVINIVGGKPHHRFLQTRMFPNTEEIEFEGKVHENVNGSLDAHKYKTLAVDKAYINHHGYDTTPEELNKKRVRNYELIKTELHKTESWYYLGGYYTSVEENPYFAMSCYMQVIIKGDAHKAMTEKCKTLIGKCFELLEIYPTAIEWYEDSEDPDAVFRCAEVYLKMDDIHNAKVKYEEYLNLNDGTTYMGDLRIAQKPLAISKLVVVCEKELGHWKEVQDSYSKE